MPYVKRDADNKITGVFAGPQDYAKELLADDNSELVAYLNPPPPPPSCQLWQLQAVMSAKQWSAAQDAVTALNNPAVTAFWAHGTNVIPANSKTLIQLGAVIGLTADQVTALVAQASAVSIP